ncbi:hypothetical protein TURU_129834 [Turdus rufiventris]|nr:hypothetical protein TURU_129834 [Turdus rufiventris]
MATSRSEDEESLAGTKRGPATPAGTVPKRRSSSRTPPLTVLFWGPPPQTNDLTSVHLGVKFSCRFTLREIQERWYSLLYDPVICK